MKSKSILFFGLVFMSVGVFFSCKKDKPTPTDTVPVETGKVTVFLNHKWGMDDFELNTQYVHELTDDTLNFTLFKYYISNFKLKKSNGTWWTHPESYFLVNLANPSSKNFELQGIPLGTYTDISYTLGVDSLRNVSGAQTGALSTTNAMFWSWSSGYIMLKAEGQSPQSTGGSFAYHLGGFAGIDNVVTVKNENFGNNHLNITTTSTGTVNILVNPSTMFTNFGSVSNGNIHSSGHNAKVIADDFYGDISFDYLTN